MSWYSLYGTGATIHGIEFTDEGRVEFSSWLSVFWVPIIPLASWSAVYAGENLGDGIFDESHCFLNLQRIPHDWSKLSKIFLRGIIVAVIAVAPAGYMIYRTNGRAATKIETAIVLLSAGWPVVLVIWLSKVRKRKLLGL